MTAKQTFKQIADLTDRLGQQFPYLPRAFRLVRHAAGGLAIVWMLLLVVQGLLPVATVYLTRTLVDGIAAMVGAGGGWRNMAILLPAGAAMGGVLLTFGIWIPLLLLFSTLPALWVVLRHTIRFHRWRIQNTMAIRKTSYYDLMLTQRESSAEMRLFGLGGLALFYQAFYQGQRMMRSLLGSAGEIYRNIMFLENLFEFLDLKPRIGLPEAPVPCYG